MLKRSCIPTALALCLAFAPAARAQQDERGYLEAFLEDNLSVDGMQVGITGLTGTLSSTANIEQLTLSDADGIWLTLDGVVLDWDRSGLLSGEVLINELTTRRIELSRLPQTAQSPATAEASAPFSLPELPVSLQIGRIAAETIILGTPILGQPVTAKLEGSASMVGGQGQGSLRIDRIDDGPAGKLALGVDFNNETNNLTVSVAVAEDAGGIAAAAIGLPGLPATDLKINGSGPLTDFHADLNLATDGVTRLSGAVVLASTATRNGPVQGFSAQLSGNPAPLFVPEYAGFLGDQIALDVTGSLPTTGGVELTNLSLAARSLRLNGHLSLAADGLPDAFDLTGEIALPDGSPVLLPLSGDGQTWLNKAELKLAFDGRGGNEGWTADIAVQGLTHPQIDLSQVALKGSGRISRSGGPARVGGTVTWTAEGVSPADAAIARATGSVLWGGTKFFWSEGSGALALRDLSAQGEDYALTGTVDLNSLSADSLIDARIDLSATDIGRFSDFAGLPLGGATDARIVARLNPLSGGADVELTANAQALALGVDPLDRLLSDKSTVSASLLRDTSGVHLRDLQIASRSFLATAKGNLSSGAMDLAANLKMDQMSDLGPEFAGAIVAEVTAKGSPDAPEIALSAKGQDMSVGQSDVDKLIAGKTQITAAITGHNGLWTVENLSLTGPQLTATGKGQTDGATSTLQIDAKLRDLGLFVADFPGSMNLSGQIGQGATGYQLNLKAQGPAGIDLTAVGTVTAGFDRADLAIKGRAKAAMANPFLKPRSLSGDLGFDLAIRGPLGLDAVSGPIVLRGGRLADPGLPFSLTDLAATLRLGSGKVNIDTTAAISTGGSLAVKGDLSLAAPYVARLGIDIAQAKLRDPALYDIPLSGKLSLNGPILGSGGVLSGRIDVGRSELRLPSTGVSGADLLPGLRHVNEPADANATRRHAGMIADASAQGAGSSSNLALDLLVSAPSQIFLRGRGLDAELGGQLHLTGPLSAINPQGGIALIRGRLEILGRRLDLDRANITMEGALIPTLDIAADTETSNHTVSVTVEGPATDPKVGFSSSPELPEEEVLALLLFDRDSQSLSPLQALQLAEAVAMLAGRGGEGMISRLRKGTGLDNLDLRTNAAGESTVTAGKYLTEKIYSEIAVEQNGKSQINLNLDLNTTTKLRARTNNEGSSGIGIVIEKDY